MLAKLRSPRSIHIKKERQRRYCGYRNPNIWQVPTRPNCTCAGNIKRSSFRSEAKRARRSRSPGRRAGGRDGQARLSFSRCFALWPFLWSRARYLRVCLCHCGSGDIRSAAATKMESLQVLHFFSYRVCIDVRKNMDLHVTEVTLCVFLFLRISISCASTSCFVLIMRIRCKTNIYISCLTNMSMNINQLSLYTVSI